MSRNQGQPRGQCKNGTMYNGMYTSVNARRPATRTPNVCHGRIANWVRKRCGAVLAACRQYHRRANRVPPRTATAENSSRRSPMMGETCCSEINRSRSHFARRGGRLVIVMKHLELDRDHRSDAREPDVSD